MRAMMKRMKVWVLAVVMLLIGVMVPVMRTEPAWAEATTCPEGAEDCVNTNILKGDGIGTDEGGIKWLLKLVVNILLYGLGAAATLGVVIAGIMYITARDNPQQVTKAKTRLIEIAIGLLAWAMLFAVLQFLIPGFTGI